MKRFNLKSGVLAAVFGLVALPALAGQSPREGGSPAADRPTAVDRPSSGGSGGGAVAAGGSGAVAGGGNTSAVGGGSSSVSSSPSAGAAASPSFSRAERSAPMMAEPQHRSRPGGPSGDGGNRSGGERAVPRSSGASSSGGSHAPSTAAPTRAGTARGGESATPNTANANNDNAERNRPVPSWSRPRGDHPSTGTAVPRTTPPPSFHDGYGGYSGRYYDPFFGYGYPAYGFGLGFGFYDPFFYDPWAFGGYGYGYGSGYGYGAPGYGGGYGAGDPYTYGAQSSESSEDQGALKLKVKPRDAKVYVDGNFVGTVDDFDGTFQKLKLSVGHHRVMVSSDGFEPAEFDVMVTRNQTLTYEGDLKRPSK